MRRFAPAITYRAAGSPIGHGVPDGAAPHAQLEFGVGHGDGGDGMRSKEAILAHKPLVDYTAALGLGRGPDYHGPHAFKGVSAAGSKRAMPALARAVGRAVEHPGVI